MPIRCFPDGRSIQVDEWPPAPPVPDGHIAVRDFGGAVRTVRFGACYFATLPFSAIRLDHWLHARLPAADDAFGFRYDPSIVLGFADVTLVDGSQHRPRSSYSLAEALELTSEVGDAWRQQQAELAAELAEKQAALRRLPVIPRWSAWRPASLRR